MPLTTLGGPTKTTLLPKPPSQNFRKSFFPCSPRHLPMWILGKWKRILKIRETCLFRTGWKIKTSSIFFKDDTSWENRICLSASFFQFFGFSCFSLDFAGADLASWRRIWKNQRIFLSNTCSYTITYSIFFIFVSAEEKKMSERTPIFSIFGQIFSSGFLGICCYFRPRWLILTSWAWGEYFYIF